MAEATDGTAGGLQAFLDWARDKGEMNGSTALALKSTVGKVIESADEGLATDVSSLDVENLLSRWETKNKVRYKNDSLNTYKVRFRQAVALYTAWLANDPDWKRASKSSSNAAPSAPRSRRAANAAKKSPAGTAPVAPSEPAPVLSPLVAGPRLVSYDLPLRPDLLVRLNLPVDLTKDDAARISAFVASLAFSTATTTENAIGG